VNITANLDAGISYSNFTSSTLRLSAAPSSANNYEYQVLVTNPCGTIPSDVVLLNPSAPTPSISGFTSAVCEGTPVTLTATSSVPNPSYQWYVGSTAIGGANGPIYSPTSSGNYQVRVDVKGFCPSSLASSAVVIHPLPSVQIAEGTTLTLVGGSAQLTALANPSVNYSYTWFDGTTAVAGPLSSPVYQVLQPGNYSVLAVNTTTNCSATSGLTKIVRIPSANTNGATIFCEGGSVTISTSLASGSSSVRWLLNGSPMSPAQTDLPYVATTTGSYSAQFLDGSGNPIGSSGVVVGLNTTKSTDVTVNALPTASVTSSSSTTVCAGTPVNLVANTNAASPIYQWSNNGTLIAGESSSTYSPSFASDYGFKVTDGLTSCSN
jgi:hypothetical protein